MATLKQVFFLLSSLFDYSKAAFQLKKKKQKTTGVELHPKAGDQKQV